MLTDLIGSAIIGICMMLVLFYGADRQVQLEQHQSTISAQR